LIDQSSLKPINQTLDSGLIIARSGEKVVVLRELQRVIIYTRELSKQAIEGR
jgi:hypothetical protein